MRVLRTLLLFAVCIGLLTLAGFVLPGSQLALPAAIAGLGSLILALG
jgi:hypothetical protein